MIALLLTLLSPAQAGETLTITGNAGLGPQWLDFNGPLGEARGSYPAAVFDLYGIIEASQVKALRKRVPRKYRGLVPKGELRVGPSAYIPDQLIVAPSFDGAPQAYGLGWAPFSVNVPIVNKPRARLDASVALAAAAVAIEGGETFDGWMVFARPGLQGKVELEVPLAKFLVLSGGYDARVYVPQGLGEGGFGALSTKAGNLWYMGGPFAQVHARVQVPVQLPR